ncbi:hypothetical protein [Nocardia higoensis]|uniref:hypothetical protein n=1 Tax=Nocardia higoensis TaxID=228599 RepID=UPI0012F63E18|nr:hypothetical protein [Nocardia higoensis]
MRVPIALLAAPASIGLLLLGSGQAAALSVTPSAGAVSIELTPAEAQTITTMNLGPLLGALPPNYTPQAKALLGEAISRAAAAAARTPGSTLTIVVDEPLLTPPGVSVMVTPGR